MRAAARRARAVARGAGNPGPCPATAGQRLGFLVPGPGLAHSRSGRPRRHRAIAGGAVGLGVAGPRRSEYRRARALGGAVGGGDDTPRTGSRGPVVLAVRLRARLPAPPGGNTDRAPGGAPDAQGAGGLLHRRAFRAAAAPPRGRLGRGRHVGRGGLLRHADHPRQRRPGARPAAPARPARAALPHRRSAAHGPAAPPPLPARSQPPRGTPRQVSRAFHLYPGGNHRPRLGLEADPGQPPAPSRLALTDAPGGPLPRHRR